ncbi:MAG: valine--tRNA ligase, partial [Edaphobacter sp.]
TRTDINNVYLENEDMIRRLARVSSMGRKSVEDIELGWSTQAFSPVTIAVIYNRQIDVPAERERLTKDLAKYEKGLEAANRQLNNEAFMDKAPAHIVEGLRKQHAETKTLYDKTKAALEALGRE